jgi:signal transduction histidine kinase
LRRLNLWPRLVIGASLGFLVLLGVITVLILRLVDDSRDRILQERLVIAQLTARQVDSVLEHDFIALEQVATSLAAPGVAPGSSAASDQMARTLTDTGDMWLGLYLLDANGNPMAAAPARRMDVSLSRTGSSAMSEIGTLGGRAVSLPYVDGLTGTPAAMLTVPVGDPGAGAGVFLGGVVDLSRPELSGPLSAAKGLGETGHAELFDSRGLVIASTDPVAFLVPGEHRQFYLRMESANRDDVETVPLEPRNDAEARSEHAKHIMAIGLLSDAPWGAAVGGSESETLAPVTDLRNQMFLLGAVSLVVLWFVTLIGARILVRPVRALTGAAARITHGDLGTPIHVVEGGEIGRLGETLEAMRVRLKVSLEEIEQRDRELEHRVEERTREVQALLEELRRKEEVRAQLLEKVISAQEEERKRIARELHDETGQALTGIVMALEAAQNALERDPGTVGQRLDGAKSLASQSIDAIRHLVVDLRPAVLDDLGLVPAVRTFAENRLRERGIRLEMDVSGLRGRLAPPVETCLFRVVQEAVTNIIRHSEAKSAHIELRRANGVVSLLVADDGRGFDFGQVMQSPDPSRALGLAGMQERVSVLGGRLEVDSAPGRGTRVQATIRIEPERARR